MSPIDDESPEEETDKVQKRKNELFKILDTASPFSGRGYFQVRYYLKLDFLPCLFCQFIVVHKFNTTLGGHVMYVKKTISLLNLYAKK